jgi:hypothetical protein
MTQLPLSSSALEQQATTPSWNPQKPMPQLSGRSMPVSVTYTTRLM